MLQKRGLVDQSECCTVGTKLQQQEFAQSAISFNFHLTLFQAPISFFSVTIKGAVTLSNSKGGFRRGPKGAFFP